MAHKVSLDSEGFSQVIAKELDLTPQQVSRLADKDVDISSMEEFCCLKMKELDKLFPGLNIKQKKCFRMLKKRFEREPPPAGARSPPKRGESDTCEPITMATNNEYAVARPIAQVSICAQCSHQFEAPQALHCTQRGICSLPLKVKREEKEHRFIHYEVKLPDQEEAHAEKVVLFAGAAGSGMKLLLNFISTILCGVSEGQKCQVPIPPHSADTEHEVIPITAYTFPRRGTILPYSLTIVIAPAASFSNEVPPVCSSNECTVDTIKDIFFRLQFIDQLHGIAFVTNASKNTITPAEQSILESMRRIFGADVHRNLFILNTFADSRKPNAVATLQAAGIHFHQAFQFNCSPLLPASDCGYEGFDKLNWEMSKNSLTAFLQCIAEIPSVNLQNTHTAEDDYD